jgi:hypothetical protein
VRIDRDLCAWAGRSSADRETALGDDDVRCRDFPSSRGAARLHALHVRRFSRRPAFRRRGLELPKWPSLCRRPRSVEQIGVMDAVRFRLDGRLARSAGRGRRRRARGHLTGTGSGRKG